MKNKTKHFFQFKIAFFAAAIFFLVIYCAFKLHYFFSGHFSPYCLTEWLANYSAGFIRRGLAGTALLFLHSKGISAYGAIVLGNCILYAVFAFIYIRKVVANLKNLDFYCMVTILFLPSLILFPLALTNSLSNVFGRKEILFLLFLFLHISILNRLFKKDSFSADRYFKTAFVWLNLFGVAIVLTHEAFVFLSLPINIIISIHVFLKDKPEKRNALVRSVLLYAPILLSSLVVFLWKGNHQTTLAIWKSLHQALPSLNYTKLPPSFDALGMSVGQAVRIVAKKMVSQSNGRVLAEWLFLFVLNFSLLFAAAADITRSVAADKKASPLAGPALAGHKMSLAFAKNYFFFPLLAALPLYVLSIDWGRWFFIAGTSYIYCALNPNLINLTAANSGGRQRCGGFSDKIALNLGRFFEDAVNRFRKSPLVLWLLLGYVILFTVLPYAHMNGNFFFRGLIWQILLLLN